MATDREPAILRARGDPEPPTFLELFYDLIFIFTFFQISRALAQNLTWRGALQTGILLLVVMWVWVLTAWLTDLYDPRVSRIQFLVILLMFGGLMMSIAIPTAYTGHGMLFAGSYLAIIFVRGALIIPGTSGHEAQARSVRLIFWYALTAVPWVWGSFLTGNWRLALWGIAITADYAAARSGWPTPRLGRTQLSGRIFTAEHLFERHRQIFIISLGELILGIGLGFAQGGFAPARVIAFGVAFANAVLLFQIYFYRAKELLFSASLAPLEEVSPGISTSFAHLIMVMGVVVISVSNELTTTHPLDTGQPAWTAVIITGPVVFLLGSSLFDVVLRRVFRPRLLALIVLIATAPALNLLPPLAIAILVNLVLAAALVGELVVRGETPGRKEQRTATS